MTQGQTEPRAPGASLSAHPNRATICLEEAEILSQQAHPGNQHVLRLAAPLAAGRARPGTFAHLQCDASIPMRRPLSIMRADEEQGWIEFLYKPLGAGLARLATRKAGERISVLAPIGQPFAPDPGRPRLLAIGGGVGIPPMVFLADHLREHPHFSVMVLMGSELPFPFEIRHSRLAVLGMPAQATHAMGLCEDWGVPSRLASNAGIDGAWRGHVPELAARWLESLQPAVLAEIQLAGCGPEPMLRALAALARRFDLPCQIALEEYMACGVGGCAGCTVQVETEAGPAMKRVCVDGPVFEAAAIYPAC
jgi:dihydroorotate dehydrogenase electron transfer subunit